MVRKLVMACSYTVEIHIDETPQSGNVDAGNMWVYPGDAYFCVETQQCATNVILNPELHVLGIFFFKKKTSIEPIN